MSPETAKALHEMVQREVKSFCDDADDISPGEVHVHLELEVQETKTLHCNGV